MKLRKIGYTITGYFLCYPFAFVAVELLSLICPAPPLDHVFDASLPSCVWMWRIFLILAALSLFMIKQCCELWHDIGKWFWERVIGLRRVNP